MIGRTYYWPISGRQAAELHALEYRALPPMPPSCLGERLYASHDEARSVAEAWRDQNARLAAVAKVNLAAPTPDQDGVLTLADNTAIAALNKGLIGLVELVDVASPEIDREDTLSHA